MYIPFFGRNVTVLSTFAQINVWSIGILSLHLIIASGLKCHQQENKGKYKH